MRRFRRKRPARMGDFFARNFHFVSQNLSVYNCVSRLSNGHEKTGGIRQDGAPDAN
jgi:hypothetical protein